MLHLAMAIDFPSIYRYIYRSVGVAQEKEVGPVFFFFFYEKVGPVLSIYESGDGMMVPFSI